MKTNHFLLALIPLLAGCGNDSVTDRPLAQRSIQNSEDKNDSLVTIAPLPSYIEKLEEDNNISYDKIINTRGAYITSMCYTKTRDPLTETVSNPCYSCHTKGNIPNYYNDTNLQEEYNFPAEMMKKTRDEGFGKRLQLC